MAHLQPLKAQITQYSFQVLSLLSAHYRGCISGIVGSHLGGCQPQVASYLLSWLTVCTTSSEAQQGNPGKTPQSAQETQCYKAWAKGQR